MKSQKLRKFVFNALILTIVFIKVFYINNCLNAQANYVLEGQIIITENQPKLYTKDGRIFNLIGKDISYYNKFIDIPVIVNGYVKQHLSDDIMQLVVKQIDIKQLSQSEVVMPPYKPHQKSPKLVKRDNNIFVLQDVRWGTEFVAGANYQHIYETVVIDTSLVTKAYFVLKPFPPEFIAAHSLLFFGFEEPGIVTVDKKSSSRGLFLSIEAKQRTNQSYSLIKGLKNYFGITWILTSYEDYIDEIKYKKEELKFYPLRLSKAQIRVLLEECIKNATVNRDGEFYNTITNNCTNNLVMLINRVLEPNKRINMWLIPYFVYNFKATLPVAVPKYLQKKGIISSDVKSISYKEN